MTLTFKQAIKDDAGVAQRLSGATGTVVSPDGRQVYVTSANDSALTVFDRDGFGNLTLRQTLDDLPANGDELFGAAGITVSPDGSQIFVASAGDHSLTVFNRSATGDLSLAQVLKDGRGAIQALEGATGVAADATQVYVASQLDDSLTVLDRSGGSLTFRYVVTDGLAGATELAGATGVALSPDDTQVYVVSRSDAALTVFDRDPTGNIAFRQVIKDNDGGGATRLAGASGVAVSPDGDHIYVVSADEAAISVFSRNPAGELSFQQVIADNTDGAELFGATSVTVSPDGAQVFVAAVNDNALTVFDRDAAGNLTVSQTIQDQDGRSGADELAGAIGVAVSPDNDQVFVTSSVDSALSVFNRDLAPRLLSLARQGSADGLVFRATFDEVVKNVSAEDFTVSGGSTAAVTAVTPVSPTVYDITVAGGNLASFSGTVGLDLAPAQDIADPRDNRLVQAEPAVDEVYTLTNGGPPATGGDALQLTIEQVNLDTVAELLIFSVNGPDRTQVGSFFLLEDGLPESYAPRFSLLDVEANSLEFELVVNGEVRTADITALDDGQTRLDFGEQAALLLAAAQADNLLVDDATAIDLTGQTGTVTLEFSVYREAALDSTLGLYAADFADGGIRDDLTGAVLRPGQAGYREAALANRLDVALTGENGQVNTFSAELAAGDFLAMYLVVDGVDPTAGEVLFSHAGANGGNDHARLLGDNLFGFEDIVGLGDRDYNDLVVEFSVA